MQVPHQCTKLKSHHMMSMLAERLLSGTQASSSQPSTGFARQHATDRSGAMGACTSRQPIAGHTRARTLSQLTRCWRNDHSIRNQRSNRSGSASVVLSTPCRRCSTASTAHLQPVAAATPAADRRSLRQPSVASHAPRLGVLSAEAPAQRTAHIRGGRQQRQHRRQNTRAGRCRCACCMSLSSAEQTFLARSAIIKVMHMVPAKLRCGF